MPWLVYIQGRAVPLFFSKEKSIPGGIDWGRELEREERGRGIDQLELINKLVKKNSDYISW